MNPSRPAWILLVVLLAGCIQVQVDAPNAEAPHANSSSPSSHATATSSPSKSAPTSTAKHTSASSSMEAQPQAPPAPNHAEWLPASSFVKPSFTIRPIDLYWAAGEPTIAVDPDGNFLLHAPGCLTNVTCQDGQHDDAPVAESRDEGRTWFALNRPTTGYLGDHPNETVAPDALEAHVAVAPDGTRYLFAMEQVPQTEVETGAGTVGQYTDFGRLFRSSGPDMPWMFVRDVYDADQFDRPWVAAGGRGLVVLSWNGFGAPAMTSRDYGATWTEPQHCPGCGLPSPAALGPVGPVAYLGTYMAPTETPTVDVPGLAMNTGQGVFGTTDGENWTAWPTPYAHKRPVVSTALINGAILPTAAVTGDGTIVLAWSQFDGDPTGYGVILGTSVWFTSSPDGGATWTPAVKLSSRANAIMPWLVAGGGDHFAVAYYTTDTPGEPSRTYTAVWDVAVTVVQDASTANSARHEVVAEAGVHRGSICTSGTGCAASDRYTILDFLTAASTPDGRIVVAYTADDPNESPFEPFMRHAGLSRQGVIRVAVQEAGSPLFESNR